MTITPLQFMSSDTTPVALCSDADLKLQHPRIGSDIWEGMQNYGLILQAAFAQVLIDLATRGYELSKLPNSTNNRAFAKLATLERALSDIFLDFVGESGDRWMIFHDDHEAKYQRIMDRVKMEYDVDGTGTVTADEIQSEPVRLVR